MLAVEIDLSDLTSAESLVWLEVAEVARDDLVDCVDDVSDRAELASLSDRDFDSASPRPSDPRRALVESFM